MKKALLLLLLLSLAKVASAFWNGTAPWCVVDEEGNGYCFYWSHRGCVKAADANDWVCELNPDR